MLSCTSRSYFSAAVHSITDAANLACHDQCATQQGEHHTEGLEHLVSSRPGKEKDRNVKTRVMFDESERSHFAEENIACSIDSRHGGNGTSSPPWKKIQMYRFSFLNFILFFPFSR